MAPSFDLGAVDAAAGIWLNRLQRQDLPGCALLEAARRREASARQHAEALAKAEQGRANLATEYLAKEKVLHEHRLKLLDESKAAVGSEQRLRADAEAALAAAMRQLQEAREALALEASARRSAEEVLKKQSHKVEELEAVLQEDETLAILDEFREKSESQRRQIALLRKQLEASEEEASSTAAALQEVRSEFAAKQQQWLSEN
ncbi:unnamed protein product, partial [Symbiodinium sp. CCMP2456]